MLPDYAIVGVLPSQDFAEFLVTWHEACQATRPGERDGGFAQDRTPNICRLLCQELNYTAIMATLYVDIKRKSLLTMHGDAFLSRDADPNPNGENSLVPARH